MSKILPIKPPLSSKPKAAIATASTRRHCALECAVYTHLSDDYMLDHMLHASAAKVGDAVFVGDADNQPLLTVEIE